MNEVEKMYENAGVKYINLNACKIKKKIKTLTDEYNTLLHSGNLTRTIKLKIDAKIEVLKELLCG